MWRNIILAVVAVLVVGAAFAVWHFYFRPPPIERASVERMAYPLPDKPSIAVLPFVNMSEDPKQEYFSDGLTDQIINSLSKVPYLFVIARISTFTYKGKPVKAQKVAEDLGVRYVLEGSVQRSADRVRITAQLIDATTGLHMWSERYDRELKDIFAIQDDITMEITKAMRIELTEGEQARLWQKRSTKNLKAYLKYLEGTSYQYRLTKKDNTRARELFEEAIALDPGFANAYVGLSAAHWYDARYGWVESRAKSIKIAFKYAQQAMELDDTSDLAHTLIGAVYLLKGQHEKNIAQAERALVLNPNGAHNNAFMAGALGCSGRWEESIGYAEKAMRLAPFPPVWFFWILGRSYFMTGQYEKAVETLKKAVHVSPDYLIAHAFLAASLSSLERQAEAAAEADEVLRINPKFSLDSYAKTLPYKNKADIERYLAALRKAGLPQTPPLPLPDKPSIAVLPFVNMSGDPGQEYFSDGITEEIITALSKTPKLFVIARNSAFTYKGKSVKVQQIGRELGVKYVLEGSVRKTEEKVRITAQLVDAKTGNHLWAERYDRNLKDIFALQDEITLKIITELQVKLTEGERLRLYSKGTDNLKAYLKLWEAAEHFLRMNDEGNAKARNLYEDVIALDPEYPEAYASLGWTHLLDVWLESSRSPGESIRRAFELARKSVALDDSCQPAYSLMSNIYLIQRQHEKAIAEAEKAIALDPNSADAYAFLGQVLVFSGKPEEAVLSLEKAIRLNPIAPSWYMHMIGMAYREMGRHEESITACKKAIQRQPDNLFAYLVLAATYSLLGREDEARAAAAEILRISPRFSLDYFAKTRPHIDPANTASYIDALRKAGLK
jgi:TolB-like protein/Tfp pilus assembly protein PilF